MTFRKSKFKIDTSKKGIDKRTYDGVLYDSEMELKFYRDYLIPLKEKGIVKNIILQPKYQVQEKFTKYGKSVLPIHYVADFEVEWSDGSTIVYDVKGLPTPEAKIKRKLFDYAYPDKTLQWVALSIQDGGWVQYEDLIKARNKRKKDRAAKNGKT